MKDDDFKDIDFYNSSILIDIYKYPDDGGMLKKKVDEIIEVIYPQTMFKRSGRDYDNYRSHLMRIILCLIVSVITSRPIATSRNRNNFTTDSRYEKIQFNYTFLIKTLDALTNLNYIEQAIGIFGSTYKRVTRFWPTDKFIDLLGDSIFKAPLKEHGGELIRLRGKKNHKNDKKYIGYNDADHLLVPQLRKDLELINNVNQMADIQLNINNEVVPYHMLEHIQNNNYTDNVLIVKSQKVSFKIIRSTTDDINEKFAIKSSGFNYKHAYNNLHIENNRNKQLYSFNIIPIDPMLPVNKFFNDARVVPDKMNYISGKLLELTKTRNNNDYFYIDELNVELLNKKFYRTFNVDFDHGGRFYNSLIQQIPSYLRGHITINGNKTVELDYSAFHLRLLYGLEKIDYQEDPYEILIDKCPTSNTKLDEGCFCLPRSLSDFCILLLSQPA